MYISRYAELARNVLSTCKIGGSFRSLVFNKAFSYTLLESFNSVSFCLFVRRRGLDRELALQLACISSMFTNWAKLSKVL